MREKNRVGLYNESATRKGDKKSKGQKKIKTIETEPELIKMVKKKWEHRREHV